MHYFILIGPLVELTTVAAILVWRHRAYRRYRQSYLSIQAQSSALSSSVSTPLILTYGHAESGHHLKADLASAGYSHNVSSWINEVLDRDAQLVIHEVGGSEYERTVDLLLRATKWFENGSLSPERIETLGGKASVLMSYNDSLKSPAEAKVWFQRALELSY